MDHEFEEIDTWIFDLDDTLYPRHLGLGQQMERRIHEYIAQALSITPDDAALVHRDLYRRYGTSMRGLMLEHGLDPAAFLEFAHQIDCSHLHCNQALSDALERLPGRKLILTNGPRTHADAVMRRLGIIHHFEDVFDIVAAQLEPKPSRANYDRFLERHAVDPIHAAIFEDIARNLLIPHELGMTTILVLGEGVPPHDEWKLEGQDGPHVHHATFDLVEFLSNLAAERSRAS